MVLEMKLDHHREEEENKDRAKTARNAFFSFLYDQQVLSKAKSSDSHPGDQLDETETEPHPEEAGAPELPPEYR